MTIQSPVEIELKLALPPQQAAAFLKLMARRRSKPEAQDMVTRYFDTPDFALSAQGIALRVRRVGRRWLQTLKTEGQSTAGLHQREEWEWPLPAEALDFGLLATTPLAKFFRSAKLRTALDPVFETEFRRTSLRLDFADGSLVELCLDSGEIRGGRRKSEISEGELELHTGNPARLFEFALELADRVPLRLGSASKAERGYALALGVAARPVKATVPALDPFGSVAAAFSTIAHSCMVHLQANEAGFLAGRDPEYLHQVRVAMRRLRACFSLFKTALPESTFARILERLREESKVLGEARDWDVFVHEMLQALRTRRGNEAAVASFQRRCIRLGRAHVRKARAAVASTAWQRLWLEFGKLLAEGAWMREQMALTLPLEQFAAGMLQQRAAAVKKRGKQLHELDVPARHQLRIAAKKLRYAVEFFSMLYPRRRVQPYVQSLAAMQDVLGGLNDAATQLRLLEAALAGARAPDARIAGMIQGWSAASTHLQLDALTRAWEHWKKQKPFWKTSHATAQ